MALKKKGTPAKIEVIKESETQKPEFHYDKEATSESTVKPSPKKEKK